jgi:hypothetical protein
MLLLKVLVVLSFTIVGVMLFITARYGRLEAKQKKYRSIHISYAVSGYIISTLAILLTEYMVRKNGGTQGSVLFWIHLPIALSFWLLQGILLLRIWFPIFQAPMLHRRMAYSCIGLYLGTFVTGIMLIAKI